MRDEGGAEVQDQGLVVFLSVLAQLDDRVWRHSQVEPADVEELGGFDQVPVLVQVVWGEEVGGTQVSDQGPVVASDQSGTLTGADVGLHLVHGLDTGFFVFVKQSLAELVLTDGTEVDDLAGAQDIGSASGGVLGSTTGNKPWSQDLQELVENGQLRIAGLGVD